MGVHPSQNHHRRRSSAVAGPVGSVDQREEAHRLMAEGNTTRREEQKALASGDTDWSDLSSIAESLEMDHIGTGDDHSGEESGLTAKQRRQRRRRQKQRRQLDARIAGAKTSQQNIPCTDFTDRSVVNKLLVNASLILLWYLFSLSISVYNKWMFSEGATVFPFPLFTSSLHMAVQFMLSSIILYLVPSLRPKGPTAPLSAAGHSDPTEAKPIVTRLFYFTRLVPCGTATSLDIGLGNMSLKFISLTFLTMCKSSALAFVLLFAFLFRLETPSARLILIIITMTIGVIMMVAGETAFNAVGFILVIVSAFFSGFRWALTQILLLRHPATPNPFSTLFLLTPVMFSTLVVISLAVEGPIEIANGFKSFAGSHGNMFGVVLLIFPGVLAFCMISSEFALLKRSSVVTLSICGIFKEVITISAAGIVFHDRLTIINVTGLVVTIASIASYNYMKISAMRHEARKAVLADSDMESDVDDFRIANDGGRGEHRRIADPEINLLVQTSNHHYDDSMSTTPADDSSTSGRSFRARPSGIGSGAHSLTVSVSNASGQDVLPPSFVMAGTCTTGTVPSIDFPPAGPDDSLSPTRPRSNPTLPALESS